MREKEGTRSEHAALACRQVKEREMHTRSTETRIVFDLSDSPLFPPFHALQFLRSRQHWLSFASCY